MKTSIYVLITVLLLMCTAFSGQVVLDHTTGTWYNGSNYKIIPNSPVEFYIRLINDNTQTVTQYSNGFRIYGPMSFTPISGYSLLDPVIFPFLIYQGSPDIIGFTGGLFSSLPAGFDEVAFVIQTGDIAEGEFLCLDSVFFPPTGIWMWSPTGPPSWDGPHCFISETPCPAPIFDACVDSLTAYNCWFSYNFEANYENEDNSTIRYALDQGPGSINELTGRWSYNPTQSDDGTTQTLIVRTYNANCPDNYSLCSVNLSFVFEFVPGDIDFNCLVDIADLVYMIDFTFAGGPEPHNYDSFDVNGDSKFDVADIVYLVEYMFFGGPPPVG